MSRAVYGHNALVHWSCGLEVFGGFDLRKGPDWNPTRKVKDLRGRGTGFAVAAFINTTTCKLAYEELVANNELIYQSPVRRNNNSGAMFFFIIIDTRK